MSTMRNRTEAEKRSRDVRRDRRATARTVAAAVLGVLLTLFAVLNSQTVRVHWVVTTTDVPLIVVIAVCGLIGAAIAWLFVWRRRARS